MEGLRSIWSQAGVSAWGANIFQNKSSSFGVGDCEEAKSKAHGDEESDEAHCDSFWRFSFRNLLRFDSKGFWKII